MRKILVPGIALVMLFIMAMPAMAQNIYLPVTPKADIILDGIRDSGYGEERVIDSYIHGKGNGATGKVWTAWNEKGIYIFAEVYDITPNHNHQNAWERDFIEIFIDWESGATGWPALAVSAVDNCWQIRIPSQPDENSADMVSGALGDGTLKRGEDFFVTPLNGSDYNDGYAVELLLPFSYTNGVKALAAGCKFFCDFQIVDNQYGQGRSSQAFLDGTAAGVDSQYMNPSAFQGILKLSEAKVIENEEETTEKEEETKIEEETGGKEEIPDTNGGDINIIPSPQTGNAGMIILMAIMAMAAIGITVLRKRSLK